MLIASYLEPEHVETIGQVDPRVDVVYEPDLLRKPRYAADHNGVPAKRSPEDEARWRRLLAEADVLFDFDYTNDCGASRTRSPCPLDPGVERGDRPVRRATALSRADGRDDLHHRERRACGTPRRVLRHGHAGFQPRTLSDARPASAQAVGAFRGDRPWSGEPSSSSVTGRSAERSGASPSPSECT